MFFANIFSDIKDIFCYGFIISFVAHIFSNHKKSFAHIFSNHKKSFADIFSDNNKFFCYAFFLKKHKAYMNIYIPDKYHHKNEESLHKIIKYLNYNEVKTLNKADVVMSSSKMFDISKYPNKKFIFGPHFGIFSKKSANNFSEQINNVHNNAIYIQPSQPSIDIWHNDYGFNKIPMYSFPFSVNTNKFKPSTDNSKDKIMLYFKNRDPEELTFIKKYLNNKNIKYKIFDYVKRYKEQNFINYLDNCKYAIWLGSHESQGFALEETLSMNVPIFVWSVKYKWQEYKNRKKNRHIKTEVNTAPYWSDKCGMKVYTKEEVKLEFDKFIKNVDNGVYEPREYILNTLSVKCVSENFKKLVDKF